MHLILSHISALECWRTKGFPESLPHDARQSVPSPYDACPPDKSSRVSSRHYGGQIERLRVGGFGFLSEPIHFLVLGAAARTRFAGGCCHVQGRSLPGGSFIQVSAEVSVCLPALSLVQMALLVPFPQLVVLMSEFCGTYRLRPGDDEGFCKADPLVDLAALAAFTDKAKGYRGMPQAQRALAYALEGSASPMETAVALLLTLPVQVGGYGLPKPHMNYQVDVRAKRQGAGSGRRFRCDLFWPEAGLCVEYDSRRYHSGSDKIAADASRRAWLASGGVEVVTVTGRQVFSSAEFDIVARVLAKRLGRRLRPGKRTWLEERRTLRSQLLSFPQKNGPDPFEFPHV